MKILHAPLVVEDSPTAVELKGFEHSIEFKNVSFGYSDQPVVKNINLVISKGKTVALVPIVEWLPTST